MNKIKYSLLTIALWSSLQAPAHAEPNCPKDAIDVCHALIEILGEAQASGELGRNGLSWDGEHILVSGPGANFAAFGFDANDKAAIAVLASDLMAKNQSFYTGFELLAISLDKNGSIGFGASSQVHHSIQAALSAYSAHHQTVQSTPSQPRSPRGEDAKKSGPDGSINAVPVKPKNPAKIPETGDIQIHKTTQPTETNWARGNRSFPSIKIPVKPDPAMKTPINVPVKPDPAMKTPINVPVKPDPAMKIPINVPVKPEPGQPMASAVKLPAQQAPKTSVANLSPMTAGPSVTTPVAPNVAAQAPAFVDPQPAPEPGQPMASAVKLPAQQAPKTSVANVSLSNTTPTATSAIRPSVIPLKSQSAFQMATNPSSGAVPQSNVASSAPMIQSRPDVISIQHASSNCGGRHIGTAEINDCFITARAGNQIAHNERAYSMDSEGKAWSCKLSGLGSRVMKNQDGTLTREGHLETIHFASRSLSHIPSGQLRTNGCLVVVQK